MGNDQHWTERRNGTDDEQPRVRREKARVPRYGVLSAGSWNSVALLLRDAKEAAAWYAVECGGFWHGLYVPLSKIHRRDCC